MNNKITMTPTHWRPSSCCPKYPQRRSLRTAGKLLIFSILLVLLVKFINLKWTQYFESFNPWSLNYFVELQDNELREYEVDTSHCKILKMSPYDPNILPFVRPTATHPRCEEASKRWSYLAGSKLRLNTTAIINSGYSADSISCCYRGITRGDIKAIDFTKYNPEIDNTISYTKKCYTINELEAKLEFQFVRVFCMSHQWPFYGDVVYREFHACPEAAPRENRQVQNTMEKWREVKKLPPSVILLGFDSVSRMNFLRSFPQTQKALDDIGAVQFKGYTKDGFCSLDLEIVVGENTFPNTAGFLAGMEVSDLAQTCQEGRESFDLPQDHCPYLWRLFEQKGYLTATVEDAPGLVGFNYLKTGFVNPPTHFYFRPFILAVHKNMLRKDFYHTDCIGAQTTEATLLNYMKGIMSFSSAAPVFLHSWFTSLMHLDINGGHIADPYVADFIRTIDLSNTVLVFLSDHGQRYGDIRGTLAGWYEDKLPILSIYLPQSVSSERPEWKRALEENAKKLTSPYDLFQSLKHILEDFSFATKVDKSTPNRYHSSQIQEYKYGTSMFEVIDETRNCGDAGISINYCACVPPKKENVTNPTVVEAANAAVSYLNAAVPKQCSQMALKSITAAASMGGHTYIVTFFALPGDFLFEATVERAEKGGAFQVKTDLLRMNKISTDVSCVTTSILQRYCYCL